MRLIDADRTKESIPETSVDIFENCARCGLLDREQVFDLIDEQPTIDAVPVVRCAECISFDTEGDGFGICQLHEMTRREEHFCSDGKRSEDD